MKQHVIKTEVNENNKATTTTMITQPNNEIIKKTFGIKKKSITLNTQHIKIVINQSHN